MRATRLAHLIQTSQVPSHSIIWSHQSIQLAS